MGKHRRTYSKRKVAPLLVLGASTASAVLPLAFIFGGTPKVEAAPTQEFSIPPTTTEVAVPSKPTKSHQANRTNKTARVIPPKSLATSSSKRPKLTQTPTSSASPTRTGSVVARPAAASPPHLSSAARTSTIARPTTTPTTTPQIVTPTTTTRPPPPPPPPIVKSSPQIVSVAKKYVSTGIPYRYGGNSITGGMDCSHFIWLVLKEAGYSVPYRDSGGLAAWTIRTTSPQPGDLVLFKGHVGIYAGDGMMIDQGTSGGAHLRQIKYFNNFIGYGRLPI